MVEIRENYALANVVCVFLGGFCLVVVCLILLLLLLLSNSDFQPQL